MAPIYLGEFEYAVLLAVLHLGEDAYAVPVRELIEQRTGRPVAQAAVFITLKRLERKGLVLSRLDEPDSGRARRYVTLTPDGLAAIEAHRAEHARLWQGFDRLFRAHKA